MPRGRGFRVGAFVLALMLVLAACGGDDDDGGGGQAAPAGSGAQQCATTEKMKIGFPGLPPDFVQMGVPLAKELGFFAANCLDVEFTGLESGIASFRAMQAGEFDMAYSGSISPVLAKGEGADAKVWMSAAALLDFQVTARPEIADCAALRGQPIATDGPGGLNHAIMEQFVATCGLDIDKDVKVLVGDPENFGVQLSRGVVKAAALHLDERITAEQQFKQDFKELGNSWEYAPDFHYSSMSATGDLIEKNRDKYIRAAASIMRATRWLRDPANKEQAVTTIAKVSEQDEAVVAQAYDQFATKFPTTCDEALRPAAYEFLIKLQVDLGNLKQAFPVTDLVDPSICAEAEALLTKQGF
jgi:ABC-type nitrate/sulfonate/bicarbonate transport system substrate-binding protein